MISARRGLLAVSIGSLGLKGAVLAALGDHPLLQPDPGLDSGVYAELARRIADGDLLLRAVPEPFFVSPLYAYAAGLVLSLGGSLFAVRVVQILLGALAVWLAGDTARRLFGDTAAVPAAALLALTGVVTFHEILILQAALDPFLTALLLWLLTRALEAPSLRRFLATGLALGALALNRPNVLPWAAIAVLAILVARGLRAGVRDAAALAAGTLLAIAPATLRNVVVAREPVLLSSHGGLNLLVGNGPGATGVYRLLDGITPNVAGQARDARALAEREEGGTLDARGVSRHFARKAFAWMRAEPAAAARLFARKLRYTLSNDEAPLNLSYPWYRRKSLLLTLSVVGPWLLVPLGAAGLVLGLLGASRLPARSFAVVASFAPAYALLVAIFFVATRYRLPLLAALAPAAGGALVLVIRAARTRERKRLAIAACVALPLLALSVAPTRLDDGSLEEDAQWMLHLAGTDARAAFDAAESLARRHPFPGVVWFRLGQAFGASGQTANAIAALERSLAIDAKQPETERALGEAHQALGLSYATSGRPADAAKELEAAVRLLPASAPARLNLAAVLAELGDRDRAAALAREALALQPGYDKAEALLRALGVR